MNISIFSSIGIITRNILSEAILQLNRNARAPKKANHGARPCSSVMRRERRKESYRRWKASTPADLDELHK